MFCRKRSLIHRSGPYRSYKYNSQMLKKMSPRRSELSLEDLEVSVNLPGFRICPGELAQVHLHSIQGRKFLSDLSTLQTGMAMGLTHAISKAKKEQPIQGQYEQLRSSHPAIFQPVQHQTVHWPLVDLLVWPCPFQLVLIWKQMQ